MFNMVSMLYLGHFLVDFLQTLYTSWYWGGAVWDCRWVILSNKRRAIALDLWWKLVLVLNFGHYSINFLQSLHVSWYYEGVLLDCISFQFFQENTELWPLIWKYGEILYTRSRSRQLQLSFHLSYDPWYMHCLCI